MAQKTVGQILVEQGVLAPQKLEQLEREAQANKVPVDLYIKQQKDISNEALAHALATQFSLKFIPTISEKMADPDILSQVPLRFLREHTVLPIIIDEQTKRIAIVTADPADFQPIDELKLIFGPQTETVVTTRSIIIDTTNKYYPLEGTKQMIAELSQEEELSDAMEFGTIESEDILGMATEAPIIKLVNHIFYQAVKKGASDIHIEPFEKELQVRFRIDGVLYTIMSPPKRAQNAITSRIKIMADLNIAEKRLPQDGRIALKIADKAIDVRVSTLPVSFGERIVMRLLDKTKTFGALNSLGLSERDYKVLMRCIEQPNGIILITGPTGSGKTSTLYSILSKLNSPEVNIVTVEDPVEYQMAGVGQVQVNEKTGLTFARALRSILRQDPDIVMIGETRDNETAQIAIQAALTGHLVLSTLHTNSAPAAITRLIDMGIEPFLIASSIIAVAAQRLVRRLCDNCKKPYQPDPELLARFGLNKESSKKITFYRPVGCEECSQTGYRGRMALFEIMEMSEPIARLTMERSETSIIQKQARADGMTLLMEDGLRKIIEGKTTIEEVLAETAVLEGL
jgi:general secretion pathway protein E